MTSREQTSSLEMVCVRHHTATVSRCIFYSDFLSSCGRVYLLRENLVLLLPYFSADSNLHFSVCDRFPAKCMEGLG